METDPQYLLKKKERLWCKERRRKKKQKGEKGSWRAFSGQKNIRPRIGCQGFPYSFSVLWNERLSYMGKKSEPPMWPAVDHIHILSDLSLSGVNGGRAIQTRGPCYLLNNRDTESSRGRFAKQHVVLGPLGERGQPRRTGVSPGKARVLQGVYSAIFLWGYKPPWASVSSVWFALSL